MSTPMRHFLALLVAGLGLGMVGSVAADDVAVSEQTFGCILDWPQVRNTRIKNSVRGRVARLEGAVTGSGSLRERALRQARALSVLCSVR